MGLEKILRSHREEILAKAIASLHRSHLEHYEAAGADEIRGRLGTLLGLVITAVLERNLAPVIRHASAVATARFEAGVDLAEVQTAYNVLEEVLWLEILKTLPAADQAEALGLVGTVLGTGKDMLARQYVSLATQTRTPSLDLKALFSGTDSL